MMDSLSGGRDHATTPDASLQFAASQVRDQGALRCIVRSAPAGTLFTCVKCRTERTDPGESVCTKCLAQDWLQESFDGERRGRIAGIAVCLLAVFAVLYCLLYLACARAAVISRTVKPAGKGTRIR